MIPLNITHTPWRTQRSGMKGMENFVNFMHSRNCRFFAKCIKRKKRCFQQKVRQQQINSKITDRRKATRVSIQINIQLKEIEKVKRKRNWVRSRRKTNSSWMKDISREKKITRKCACLYNCQVDLWCTSICVCVSLWCKEIHIASWSLLAQHCWVYFYISFKYRTNI